MTGGVEVWLCQTSESNRPMADWTDHSTFGERLYRNREERWKRAYGFLFAGMLVIGIAGIVQVLLGMVVPS